MRSQLVVRWQSAPQKEAASWRFRATTQEPGGRRRWPGRRGRRRGDRRCRRGAPADPAGWACQPLEDRVDVMVPGRPRHQAPERAPGAVVGGAEELDLLAEVGWCRLHPPLEPFGAEIVVGLVPAGVEHQPHGEQQLVHGAAVDLGDETTGPLGEVTHSRSGRCHGVRLSRWMTIVQHRTDLAGSIILSICLLHSTFFEQLPFLRTRGHRPGWNLA